MALDRNVLAAARDSEVLEFLAEKFGLREHMQFNCYVEKMVFDEGANTWTLFLKDGRILTTHFVPTAIGFVGAHSSCIDGVDDYKGQAFHTFNWPHEPINLTGQRVAVIGTGATSIQLIPEVAKEAAH